MIIVKSQIILFLQEFEKNPDPDFLIDDDIFDAIYFHKINLLEFPKFNQLYTDFLEHFL